MTLPCHTERLLHTKQARGITMMMVCGLAANSDSVHKADNRLPDETEESLIPSSFPSRSLSLQPANRQYQRCMQLLLDALTLDGGRTGLD